MIIKINDTDKVENLFEGCTDSSIWSCLQGIMGAVYAPLMEQSDCAVAIIGEFAFYVGKPNKELITYKPDDYEGDFIIMVPQNEEWSMLIEEMYGDKAKRITRYAIKKEGDVFDREKLKAFVAELPNEYELAMIDEHLFKKCGEEAWSREFVSNYKDYDMYKKHGLGVLILKDGEPVAGVSSYSGYKDGIEIDIVTREDYRKKGLATVCAAKIILECLERNWYPSWDARTKISVALAEKLGYHFDKEYVAYDVFAF